MSKVKLIAFDLDGVLIETKEFHFKALNEALGKEYEISLSEHLSIYDGLKTTRKLELLGQNKGLPIELHSKVWEDKQKITLDYLSSIEPNQDLIDCLSRLSQDGYKIACCSNSIRKSVLTILSRLGIISFFDYIVSNEDVKNGKPHPEMYWKAMSNFSVSPKQTLVVEDSPAGLLAAELSGANIFRVESPKDVSYDKLTKDTKNKMTEYSPKWVNKKMNVLIPMAGAGSRFEQAGYTFPKPLIEVNKKPMIQVVVDNLNIEANYIYIVQKSHRAKYNLDSLLNLITPDCKIVEVDGITEGAACSALLAKEHINDDNPLFFANSDQVAEWNSSEFLYKMQETNSDGGILTFKSTHPKWSFAKLDELGFVEEVAEKNPISDNATVGYYYWRKGSDFVKYAERMIDKDVRVNNEFYVCPVFNQAIESGLKISSFEAKAMWGLGTPEDLNIYLSKINNEAHIS
jgi:HAD superfamily hydrolase (TIGR01509 family)